ncbi:MAG: type 1 glutamine amidotransferase [Sulfitobacter sp.]|nr:type 1 glutamine amidotransferase [Sulfitobacter sp.]
MHLAILMTNTDESEFAQRHPKDEEKFSQLIQGVRPDWRISSYDVKDGVFPDDILGFDGIMITGSPASVLEQEDWVTRLLGEIRLAYEARVPIFGACFGHQAVALALGGQVEPNVAGWGFGLIEMRVVDRPTWYVGGDTLLQYGAHIDHVTRLPEGARQIFTTDHADLAGFLIEDRVYTTQNHPEMTPEFVAALVEEYSTKIDAEVIERARQSLTRIADTVLFAQSIAAFFEAATEAGSAH